MVLLIELCTDFTKEPFPLRQVIINTHSPVLVKDTFTLTNSKAATVWLAQLVSQAITIMVSFIVENFSTMNDIRYT